MRLSTHVPLIAILLLPLAGVPDLSAQVHYAWESPDAVHELHPALVEISGLAWIGDGFLAAVEDETGHLYRIDASDGAPAGVFEFGPAGDYEGITDTGPVLYILRSDGLLFRIDRGQGEPSISTLKTGLSGRNDAEGIVWDQASEKLLIALKGHPAIDMGSARTVFTFDPADGGLGRSPALVITEMHVDDTDDFRPSGIAIHPKTDHLYVLSGRSRELLVMDRGGQVVEYTSLDVDNMDQPEGIAFSPSGTLYIASEGDGRAGHLFTFRPIEDK